MSNNAAIHVNMKELYAKLPNFQMLKAELHLEIVSRSSKGTAQAALLECP